MPLNTNLTTTSSVQPLFTPVLNRYIIETALPYLAFNQFGQKAKIPQGKGKTIAWDKWDPLPLAKTPLTEGVTPDGAALSVTRITEVPRQYGNYVATSDEFDFYKYDPTPEALKKAEILGENAGETFDSLTCDVVASGTNVQYAGGRATRSELTANDKLTVAEIVKAVRTLKANKARRKDGCYICILDPFTAYDLMRDEEWKNVKVHDPKDLYHGEIGELYGVRFIQTTETTPDVLKIWNSGKTAAGATGYISCTSTDAGALKVVASGATTGEINLDDVKDAMIDGSTPKANDYVVTKSETNVHFVYVFGADAYGTVDEKGNVETIVHDKHQIGGPLDQYSTIGWKGHHVAKILVDEWLVRLECNVSE